MHNLDYLINEICKNLSAIGIIIALITFPYLKSKNKSNIFLSLYFLISGIYALLHYNLLNNGNPKIVALLYATTAPLVYLFRPVSYIYVRSMLTKKIEFKKWDYLLILPAVLYVFDVMPYLLTSFDNKIRLAYLLMEDQNNIFRYPVTYFSTPKFHFNFRPLFSLAVSFAELAMLYKYFKNNPQQKIDYPTTYNWLWTFSLIGATLTLALSVVSLSINTLDHHSKLTYDGTLVFMNISNSLFLCLNISVFLFPRMLYGLSAEPETNTSFTFRPEIIVNNKVEEQIKPSFKLEEARVSEIEIMIQEYFIQEKPYLDDSFTINKLSESLDIPIHHLSYYFNYHLLKKFSDFKNECRINYAIQLLKEGILKKYTIEQLYHEAGFSTKSNFYRVFRLHTGKTPIEFLEEINA